MLSTQDTGYAVFTRIVLTLACARATAFMVTLLDALTQWQQPSSDPRWRNPSASAVACVGAMADITLSTQLM